MTAPVDLRLSPHGQTRERRVPCRRCSTMTPNWAAICDRCHTRAGRLAAVAGLPATEHPCNRCGAAFGGRGGLCWQCIEQGHKPADWPDVEEF